MCFVEQMHYKCGHKNQGKVSKCRKFLAANVGHLFLRKPVDCGNAVLIHHDLPGICLTCTVSQAKKLMEKKKRREMELRKQEQRRRERAQFTAQAAAEKKKKEEELMRRQRMERERQRKRKERGHAMSREEMEALRRERVERARRERNRRPQETRDLPAVSSTTPSMSRPGNPISRSNEHHFRQDGTATLKDPRGRTRNAETKPQVRPQVDTLPVQTVAARKPVVVNPPVSGIPQPSRARLVAAPSTGEQRRSGVEQGPPVPPKDPWRPHHPSLAPAPLSVPRSRPDGSAGASAGQPSRKPVGHIREGPNTPPAPSQKTQVPQRSVTVPGGVSSSSGGSSSRRLPSTAAPAQKSSLPVPAGYKPSAVFANRQGNNKSATATARTPAEAAAGAAASVVAKVRARAKEAAASSSSSSSSSSSPPLVRGKQQALPSANNTAAAPPKEEKKSRKSLLKKMMIGLGSDESFEWVSKDAARIERGE
ncbi:hypothetical protein MYCTH_91802 [Thermothelomyces thermophilus ATCC 42464]|uniref:Uncharacterized protein n=1 Tax=Thermothelomyces thermophilus (strain ATCC 42464 / BCRC 31852 / DSM 1799) TaxID=573729 RepID=G2Q3A5_THET4|nr:uncharacterized protein MYCTH_91802 [Thermothelomyces thermophilus ATCC 42464]AEO54366.1 hypothetical protein MYCTH_91802 [Thermothelomyces thermophilus ATCC 42464]